MKRVHPAWRLVAALFVVAGLAAGARAAKKTEVHSIVPRPAVRVIGAAAGALSGLLAFRVVWVLASLAREGARIRADRKGSRTFSPQSA